MKLEKVTARYLVSVLCIVLNFDFLTYVAITLSGSSNLPLGTLPYSIALGFDFLFSNLSISLVIGSNSFRAASMSFAEYHQEAKNIAMPKMDPRVLFATSRLEQQHRKRQCQGMRCIAWGALLAWRRRGHVWPMWRRWLTASGKEKKRWGF